MYITLKKRERVSSSTLDSYHLIANFSKYESVLFNRSEVKETLILIKASSPNEHRIRPSNTSYAHTTPGNTGISPPLCWGTRFPNEAFHRSEIRICCQSALSNPSFQLTLRRVGSRLS
ncbi:hypothetical protein TNCT_118071 [Trichonephila clavata]|uniref:Uncharacterized protein n=1 Tax=Trichonephila clavata TaxID=2740835 RepID=A0A8X6M3Q3_TRICU|nr:hypothetical protein TNCT_118071 [Trichonephila clavata]